MTWFSAIVWDPIVAFNLEKAKSKANIGFPKEDRTENGYGRAVTCASF